MSDPAHFRNVVPNDWDAGPQAFTGVFAKPWEYKDPRNTAEDKAFTEQWHYFDVETRVPEKPAEFVKLYGTRDQIGCQMGSWRADICLARRHPDGV